MACLYSWDKTPVDATAWLANPIYRRIQITAYHSPIDSAGEAQSLLDTDTSLEKV